MSTFPDSLHISPINWGDPRGIMDDQQIADLKRDTGWDISLDDCEVATKFFETPQFALYAEYNDEVVETIVWKFEDGNLTETDLETELDELTPEQAAQLKEASGL